MIATIILSVCKKKSPPLHWIYFQVFFCFFFRFIASWNGFHQLLFPNQFRSMSIPLEEMIRGMYLWGIHFAWTCCNITYKSSPLILLWWIQEQNHPIQRLSSHTHNFSTLCSSKAKKKKKGKEKEKKVELMTMQAQAPWACFSVVNFLLSKFGMMQTHWAPWVLCL